MENRIYVWINSVTMMRSGHNCNYGGLGQQCNWDGERDGQKEKVRPIWVDNWL